MFFASKYHDLDLPVHSPETQVALGGRIWAAGKTATGPTFVRGMTIDVPRQLGRLAKVLTKTDKELELAAQACDATVVEHHWGLYPIRDALPDEYEDYLPADRRRLGMPKGHILVAEVAVVRDATAVSGLSSPEGVYDRIFSGLRDYCGVKRLRLSDMKVSAFATGFVPQTTTEATETTAREWLIDIEPRLWEL
jgi:hypothetical protein